MKCRDCRLTVNPDTITCPRCGAIHPAREIIAVKEPES